jgi:hypothetical protein
MTAEKYERYLETLDESLLSFRLGEEPTRFLLKTRLDWDTSNRFKAESIRVDAKRGGNLSDMNVSVNVAVQYEKARAHLIDVINPASVEEDQKLVWKADKADGWTDKELMLMLDAHGIVNDLISALRFHERADGTNERTKKK